ESMMFHRLIGYRGLLARRYEDVKTEQSFTIEEKCSELAQEALKLSDNASVLFNNKTYVADGHPAVHLLQEIPLDLLDRQVADDLVEGNEPPPVSIFEFDRYT